MAALIAAQRAEHRIPATVACRALGVSRSWFYKWKSARPGPRAERRQRLAAEVKRLFEAHGGKYGAPRITDDLRDEGWRVSENTVAALMRAQGLAARRKKRRRATTRPGRGRWRAPDLVKRDFPAAVVNRKWYGDGTEMLAEACGLNPQGGSAQATLFRTRDSEPGLGAHLIVERGPTRPRWSYFLRADTMRTLYSYLEDNPGRRPERLHEVSHGEGFLEILRTRVGQPGFYLMDEPDAPLSFTACLGLAALLHDLAQEGSQAIVATHSPIVAAVPDANILELGDWGIRTARREDLHLVGAWRRFMAEPASYFRHLLADDIQPSDP